MVRFLLCKTDWDESNPGESDFITVPLGNNRAMIAPLWDDYLLSPLLDNSVRAEYVAGQYLSVTCT